MWINFHIFYKDDVKYLMHKILLYYGVEKLNIKYLAIVLFFVLVIFSISAVSAANETVADDVNEISDSSIDSINPSNSNGSYNIKSPADNLNGSFGFFYPDYLYSNSNNANSSVSEDVSYLNFSGSYSSDFPTLEVSVKTDENKGMYNFVDLSLNFEDYSLNINNRNFFFSLNQSFKNSSNNHLNEDNNIIDVITSIKNNNLFLNVNFLNLSNQTIELYSSENFLNNLLNMILSFFSSLFK